uniref:Uncharacterized protein n=1 Tax=Anguilla anguilla TaxID=7936 RepID=A0A0E9XEN5_ANGAN
MKVVFKRKKSKMSKFFLYYKGALVYVHLRRKKFCTLMPDIY